MLNGRRPSDENRFERVSFQAIGIICPVLSVRPRTMTEEGFDELWASLVKRSHQPDLHPLSESEQLFYAVNLLRGSVPRSGFVGFFENCTASDVVSAHEGLGVLGLTAVLDLLQEARNAILGPGPFTIESLSVAPISDALSDAEHDAESDRLDEALAPIEQAFHTHDGSVLQALCAYADQRELKLIG